MEVAFEWTNSDSCHCGMEPEPRGSRKEKVNAELEDIASRPEWGWEWGLVAFGEGKHTELEEVKQREAAVQSPEAIRHSFRHRPQR